MEYNTGRFIFKHNADMDSGNPQTTVCGLKQRANEPLTVHET
jgi:hypothetical protein